MSTLAEYLMEHGILKNADAEAMATEIEARFARERDQAIHEAKRRDQKWMDGINEVLGEKLDFDDPCAANAASTALSKWAAKQGAATPGPCHECREVTLPMISVTGPNVPRGTGKPRRFCSIHCFWKWIERLRQARTESGPEPRAYSWD